MNVLVTGSNGMIATALINNLYNIRDGKNNTRPDIKIEKIFECNRATSKEELVEYIVQADVIYNFAGVNRPDDEQEFWRGNYEFVKEIFELIPDDSRTRTFVQASSIQASLIGRFAFSEYGKSKKKAEDYIIQECEERNINTAIYRFPNVMGHSKPNYNSAISTFCYSIANDLPYTVNDKSTMVEVVYIDDLIESMFDVLENKEKRYENNGHFCSLPVTYNVSLGQIVELIESFKNQSKSLMIPEIPDNSFEKKLFSVYLSYLPKDKFKYDLKMNVDSRGSFTELIHTLNCGQVSINISKPGITKGQHWHNSKWEIFIVVAGHGLIQERNINTGETVEFEVCGDKIQAVYMIPGWTHNIINLSDSEDLVTVMYCNENFDISHPDTFREDV